MNDKIKDQFYRSFILVGIMAICLCCYLCSPSSAHASSSKKWQSVYADEDGLNVHSVYYVKYGGLSIARDGSKIHVKNKTTEASQKIKSNHSGYGGVLTNGKDIMYQKGKAVYLWKNAKKRIKLFSLKKKKDILVARYGNIVFYERYDFYDSYRVYKYNLKTKKHTKTDIYNAYYCNGKYLMIFGQFHEGASTPLKIYNMKTGKTLIISKHASYGNAAIISGRNVYYSELNDSDMMNYKWKIVKYNLKTKKKTILKKRLSQKPVWLDKNHYYYTIMDSADIYLCDIRDGTKTFFENQQ